MNCTEINELMLDFVEGELADHKAVEVRSHIDLCEPCKAKLRDYRGLFGELGAARSLDNRANRPEASGIAAPPGTHRGLKVIGDFEILDELGRGGMGVVYRARQISLNRVVALKVLAVGAVQSERAIQRFQHEAQAAARLHHTNIVPVYAQGHADGNFFYAMELIEGSSLSAVLRDSREITLDAHASEAAMATQASRKSKHVAAHDETLALPKRQNGVEISTTGSTTIARTGTMVRMRRGGRRYKRIARLFADVADGLHHAHEQGIVHRDIKPQNLMLGVDDKLHITDFGLARLASEPGITLSSEIVGTPAYMSPEQISHSFGEIDRRSDVYSLGVTLYETLTGMRPFVGETYDQTIAQVLNAVPKSLRKIEAQVPIDLETICLRAMEKEQVRRFPSAGAMAEDLRRYAQDFPITSRRVGPIGKAVRWVRRNKPKAVIGVAGLLLLTVTPLLLRSMAANDRKTLVEARNILLDDYRQRDAAFLQADKVSFLTSLLNANDRDVLIVRALADIVSDPENSRSMLETWIAAHRQDHEMIYLQAWATSETAATHGDDRIRETEKLIERANSLTGNKATGPGYFYRGQAQFSINLDLAIESFGKAIEAHRPSVFPQAMLHRARAMNYVMYLKRVETYFELSNDTLRALMELQPGEPYPIYLSAIAHKLHAEILAERARTANADNLEEAESAKKDLANAAKDFKTAIGLATRALDDAPSLAWGDMALANVFEAQGITAVSPDFKREAFQKAITAWSTLTTSKLANNPQIARDKAAYLMRLYYWVGEYEQALQQLEIRYAKMKAPDADRYAYAALIHSARGDVETARSTIDDGLTRFANEPVKNLKLRACAAFCGLGFVTQEAKPIESGSWEKLLRARDVGSVILLVARGQADLATINVALAKFDTSTINQNRIRSAAAFVQAGATYDDDRAEAQRLLKQSANTRDLEDFCFLAQMIMQRFELAESQSFKQPVDLE